MLTKDNERRLACIEQAIVYHETFPGPPATPDRIVLTAEVFYRFVRHGEGRRLGMTITHSGDPAGTTSVTKPGPAATNT